MKTKNLENFEKLISNENSGWLDKFLHYKNNKKWLDNSSKVAVNVLEALKTNNLSQKDLAKKLNVSAQQVNKIVRGQQNLTFETVGKLEEALGITLMEIIDYKSTDNVKTNATLVSAVEKKNSEKIAMPESFSNDFVKKQGYEMKVVYNIIKDYQEAI